MRAVIAVAPGDGVGPEVAAQAVRALEAVADRFGHAFTFKEALVGGAALDETGDPLPDSSLALCKGADAVLLGAVGGPKWDGPDLEKRPEQGLLRLRSELSVFANLRPVRAHACLAGLGPLKPEIAAGVDILVVRELTGGVYFGAKTEGDEEASDECRYTRPEVERIARLAFTLARGRSGRVASLDKANVLATSRLWRRTVERIHRDEFPEVELEHVLIDAASMLVITNPRRFDVVLTENMFGDIISDEASALVGSIGLLGSASLGARVGGAGGAGPGLFEPIHGSAPDIAGAGVANPIGAIAAAAMLLRDGLGLGDEAAAVEQAISSALGAGARTPDLGGASSTTEAGEAVRVLILDGGRA